MYSQKFNDFHTSQPCVIDNQKSCRNENEGQVMTGAVALSNVNPTRPTGILRRSLTSQPSSIRVKNLQYAWANYHESPPHRPSSLPTASASQTSRPNLQKILHRAPSP